MWRFKGIEKDFSYPNGAFYVFSDSISDAIQYTLNGDKKHIEDDIAGDKKHIEYDIAGDKKAHGLSIMSVIIHVLMET